MHIVIDDFAWIAIALALLTFVFLIGAIYILLEEGLKAMGRFFRNIAINPVVRPQRSPAHTAVRAYFSDPATARSGDVLFTSSFRKLAAETGRALEEKIEEARAGFDLRLRFRHHKP